MFCNVTVTSLLDVCNYVCNCDAFFDVVVFIEESPHTEREFLKGNDNITIELFPSIGPQAQHPYVCALAKATVTGTVK